MVDASGWSVFEMSIRLIQEKIHLCLGVCVWAVNVQIVQYFVELLNTVQFDICLLHALRLTVRNHPLLNLEINIANKKKTKFLIVLSIHAGPFSIIFCLDSIRAGTLMFIVHYEAKRKSVRNMYRRKKNSMSSLVFEIWDCEKNKIIHSYSHTRTCTRSVSI